MRLTGFGKFSAPQRAARRGRNPRTGERMQIAAKAVPRAALAATEDGVLVGTGNKGKLYRVRADRSWTMIASFPAEQLTTLVRARGIPESTQPPQSAGRIHVLEPAAGGRGTFTSKPKDTETVSSWGRVRWDAELPPGTEIQVQSRSGNTGTPDSTWTAWSAPYTNRQGTPVASEAARFLQLRAILVGQQGRSPVLDTLTPILGLHSPPERPQNKPTPPPRLHGGQRGEPNNGGTLSPPKATEETGTQKKKTCSKMRTTRSRFWRVTGPVAMMTSAWRGVPFSRTPNRSRSKRGVNAARISMSQALQAPVFRCRTHGDLILDQRTNLIQHVNSL